ncbi:MAG: hypothetical protein ACPGYV_15385, partial [Phycisphaeraceae bacterium]
TLNDGGEAIVIDHHIADPCNPMVQLLPDNRLPDVGQPLGEKVDLREDEGLWVVACDGQRTEKYNFGPDRIPGNREAIYGWA